MSSEGQSVSTVQTNNMAHEQVFSGGALAGHQVTQTCESQDTLHLSDGLPVLKQCSLSWYTIQDTVLKQPVYHMAVALYPKCL